MKRAARHFARVSREIGMEKGEWRKHKNKSEKKWLLKKEREFCIEKRKRKVPQK